MRWYLRWGWPPLYRKPREAAVLADEAENAAVRVRTEIIVPLRELREGDHLSAAVADDMTRTRRPARGDGSGSPAAS